MKNDLESYICREPMYEGQLYPEDPQELKELIKTQLKNATKPKTTCSLVLSPAAPYEEACDLICCAQFALSKLKPERLLIIASAPKECQDHPAIIVPESQSFRTPLFESLVDMDFLSVFSDTSTFLERNDIPHLSSYRIEIQLPVLHVLFPEAKIVPILVAGSSEALIRALYSGLAFASMETPARSGCILSANLSAVSDDIKDLDESDACLKQLFEGKYQEILNSETSYENRFILSFLAYLNQKPSLELLSEHLVNGFISDSDNYNRLIRCAALSSCAPELCKVFS